MEERLVALLVTAEGISEENARIVVAQMVDEIGDISIVLELYERSLAGEDLGADATTLAAVRNEVATILSEISGAEPRAQEVLRSEFDQFVKEEFGEVTPPEQEALDDIFRQMFRDFRSTGRTDFDVFFDEQFDAITEDVQQGIAQGEARQAEDALEQQRIAQAAAAVENLRIPEALKGQIIEDAVRQAEAEGLVGEVDDEQFNGIVSGLIDGLLNASPTAALELEAEAAGEDPLALSQARRFDQNIADQQAADDAAFGQFLDNQLAAGISREELAKLDEGTLRQAFQVERDRLLDEEAVTAGRRASALGRAQEVAGIAPTTQPRPDLFRTPRVGAGVPQVPSAFGQPSASAAAGFSFGDFLQQNVGSLETEDEAFKRRNRSRRATQITVT